MKIHGTGLRSDPVYHRSGPGARPRCDGGFTLLEILAVLTIATVSLVVASQVYVRFLDRSTARRSAQVFARDLSLARGNSIQTRGAVVIRFSESDLSYVVENAQGRTLAVREFDRSQDLTLSGLDLATPGDSIVFDGRGILDMSALGGSLGTATFGARGVTYTVSFNATGASRIEES